MIRNRSRSLVRVLLAAIFSIAPIMFGAEASKPAATDEVIPAAALLQPKDLAAMLKTPQKPLVLNVGPHILYAQAHVPGAEYVGAAGSSAGLAALRKRFESADKNQTIVVYCGCCPWNNCPNIRPAFEELQKLGFTHVKALYIPSNFGVDWVHKGYAAEKGR